MGDSLSYWTGIKDWAGSSASSKVVLVLVSVLFYQTEKKKYFSNSRPKIWRNSLALSSNLILVAEKYIFIVVNALTRKYMQVTLIKHYIWKELFPTPNT